MRYGILDIGTNTINLLVTDIKNKGSLKIIYEEKLPVKLGKGSMNDKILKPDAIRRAVKAINKHIDTLLKFNIINIKGFATSAVRDAKNKSEFTALIKKKWGINIQIISGEKEAEFIYKGVKHAVNMVREEVYLILDIGGGSNEFIICNSDQIFWKKSYNLGITRLIEQINPSDPLKKEDIQKLKKITDDLIEELVDQCNIFKPQVLLGASGSFETFLSMILHKKYDTDTVMKQNTSLEINMEDFRQLHNQLITSTADERKQIHGLPEWRIDMIVLASVFTKHIIDRLGINKIIYSDYSLKEGVAFEMI